MLIQRWQTLLRFVYTLESIAEYIELDDPGAAKRVVRRAFEKTDQLEDFTESGSKPRVLKGTPFSSAFISSQISIAMVLGIVACLLFRSYLNTTSRDLGFESKNVSVFRVKLPARSTMNSDSLLSFQNRLLDSLEGIPGVSSASLCAKIPMDLGFVNAGFLGSPDSEDDPKYRDRLRMARLNTISPGFFDTLGIPIIRGREFERKDGGNETKGIIISERMANWFFPEQNPIGKPFSLGDPNPREVGTWPKIVGVVGDVVFNVAKKAKLDFYTYRNIMNHDYAHDNEDVAILIKSERWYDDLAPDVRQVLKKVDERMPIVSSMTLDDHIYGSMGEEHIIMWLMVAGAVMAILLLSIGIYGVFVHDISIRRKEIGIRTALGAQDKNVVQAFVGRGVWVALFGVGIGFAVASMLSGLISPFLYGVSGFDFFTYVGVALFLLLVGFVSSALPVMGSLKQSSIQNLRFD